jgi:hypothetical protein
METVKECKFKKDYTSKDGRAGKIYDIVFSDGVIAQAFSEIPVGTAKDDLDITPGQGTFPPTVKQKKSGGFGGSPKKVNNAAFAMSYAKDLVVADKVKIDQLLPTADKIYNWIESKK